MRKIILLAAALILILFVAGCKTSGTTSVRSLTNYAGGVEGLSISFEQDAPPDLVLDNNEEDFVVSLEIKNDGEYSIPSGGIVATLSGISREDFGLSTLHTSSNFELERKTQTTPGGIEALEFGNAKVKVDYPSDFTTDMIADVCYGYRTITAASICLKQDTIQHRSQDACIIRNEDIDFENSGGPMQVTDVDETSSGSSKIKIRFTLEMNGDGDVYTPGAFSNKCDPSEHTKQKDRVKVTVSDASGRLRFDCASLGGGNSGETRLYEGKKQISCDVTTSGLQDTAYEQLISIQTDYVYRDSLKKTITIENSNVF